MSGEARITVVVLKDEVLRVFVPSNISFAPGRLPADVAAFLADRNRNLDFADWDAMDNGRRSYFTLKTQGGMDRIDLDTLSRVIHKMLVEAAALDQSLRELGYVRW
jgi:hypothetical protein